MARSEYIMNRRGEFSAAFCTANQCAFPGAEKYSYKVQCRFPGESKLNDRKFLVDHNDIDATIQALRLIGSCEQMEKVICDALVDYFIANNLQPLELRLEIGNDNEQVTANGVSREWNAWMAYICDRRDEYAASVREQFQVSAERDAARHHPYSPRHEFADYGEVG